MIVRFRNVHQVADITTTKKIDGVAMGSPLGPVLGNIFMCSIEKNWLKDCRHSLKPVFFYRSYVDDIFVLFSSLDYAENFKKYLSSKHPNINFSLEKENDGRLSLLDRDIFCENEFVTNVYWKKPFSGVYTNFNSSILETFKSGLIKSMLFRCFILCSVFEKVSHKINILKSILITAKINSREISKPYLPHQRKYILEK